MLATISPEAYHSRQRAARDREDLRTVHPAANDGGRVMPAAVRLQHVSVPMPPGGAERAREFYGRILGLEEKAPPSSLAHLGLVWFHAGPDGQEVHVFTDEEVNHASSEQHLCLQVESIDVFRRQMETANVSVQETTPITNRPRWFVRDPFDNLIEITEIVGDYD
jgi:catechol 2,3-dioxygenase-like lactoylglutathione lyase family enzyme